MRRFSLVLTILIVLGALSAPAEQLRREGEERRAVQRLLRVVRSFFQPRANSDVLTPPTPAPAPPSRP
jgi:hypothetical protein